MRIGILALVGLTVFAVLARPLWENKVVVDSDLGRAHLPSRYFYQQCLQSGDSFTWCPGQFCGYYIHGEGQGGYDHPLHRALYTFLPLVPAFNLEVFLNYPFLLAGTYLFLRRHGLSRDVALFGGLSFTFSGFNLPHYPHTNAIAIVAHIPWLLWATDVLWKSDSRCHRAFAQFAITILTASQILLGYPQYLWFSALAEGMYALVLFTSDWRWDRLALFGIAKLLGVATGAAQLLPSLEALVNSPRMVKSVAFCGSFSLNPANLLQLVVPGAFHERVQLHEYAVYAGVVLSLALVWLFIRPPTPKTELGRWAWLMALFAIPLACGRYTSLFQYYMKVPVLGVFRCPCRYLVLAHLAAAVFVAMTAAQLDKQSQTQIKIAWKRLAWLGIVPALACVVALIGTHWLGSEMEPFVNRDNSVWIGVGVFAVAACLFATAARGWRMALTLLMAISVADQAAFGLRSINLYRTAELSAYRVNEVQPPGPVHGRVDLGDVHGNALNLLDMKLTSGYVGLTPSRKLDYSTDGVQKLAGTEWRHDGTTWHQIEGWLPRVRLVTQAQMSDDPNRDLGNIDASKVVLLERGVELSPGLPGHVGVKVDRPGRIEIDAKCDTQQILVVTESFHQGWKATLDGTPIGILRAYGDFHAVVVPAGEHHVAMTFEPDSVRWGRRISIIGLLIAAGFSFGTCRWFGVSYATHCEN